MTSFVQTLTTSIVTSSLAATIVGGIFTFFINKKLDNEKRILEIRKELYSKIQEELSGLFSTNTLDNRKDHLNLLLISYRQLQLWGSEAVVVKFNDFLEAIDVKTGTSQDEKDKKYKELILAMRNDFTKDKLHMGSIKVIGKID